MSGPSFLGTDMRDPEVIPYFTWDAPLTVREIHGVLAAGDAESFRLLGKILREARDTDVWAFTSPAFVSSHWPFGTKCCRFAGSRAAELNRLLVWQPVINPAAGPLARR